MYGQLVLIFLFVRVDAQSSHSLCLAEPSLETHAARAAGQSEVAGRFLHPSACLRPLATTPHPFAFAAQHWPPKLLFYPFALGSSLLCLAKARHSPPLDVRREVAFPMLLVTAHFPAECARNSSLCSNRGTLYTNLPKVLAPTRPKCPPMATEKRRRVLLDVRRSSGMHQWIK